MICNSNLANSTLLWLKGGLSPSSGPFSFGPCAVPDSVTQVRIETQMSSNSMSFDTDTVQCTVHNLHVHGVTSFPKRAG